MLSKVRKASLHSENHDEYKKNLVADLKKNVKSLMELLAYRKLVNEDSGVVYSLCLAVEACIKHGLKRRTFETFSSSDTYYADLLTRLDQLGCASAAFVSSRLRALRSKSSQSSSTSPVVKMFTFSSKSVNEGTPHREPLKSSRSSQGNEQYSERVLWIKIALVEKHLLQILGTLATNATSIYQPHALFADPVCGPLIPALLAGPCSVDYSHLRGSDIPSYGENSIDEVMNRRKLSSTPSSIARQPSKQNLLTRARHFSIAAGDLLPNNENVGATGEVDFLFSAAGMTWPGNKAPELVYAKNNVAMEPYSGSSSVLGYLAVCVPAANVNNSDHGSGAVIRWTPNNIFHSSSSAYETSSPLIAKRMPTVVTIKLCEVSHIHCHTRPHSDSHATIVFIGRDGVQFPAMMFKQANSAFSLLQALVAAIPSNTRIEPPLSSDAFEVDTHESRDLVFQLVPTTPKSASEYVILSKFPEMTADNSDVNSGSPNSIAEEESENKVPDMEAFEHRISRGMRESKTDFDIHASSGGNSMPASKSISSGMSSTLEAALSAVTMAGAQYFNELDHPNETLEPTGSLASLRQPHPRGVNRLTNVCRSVQRQLLARAFYGWLAYVRHVKTVRNQLAALVLKRDDDDCNSKTFQFDANFAVLACATSLSENCFGTLRNLHLTNPETALTIFHKLIYLGGIEQSWMRPRIWAILLGVANLSASDADMSRIWEWNVSNYATVCQEWQTAEEQAENMAASKRFNSSDTFTPNPAYTAQNSGNSATEVALPPPTSTIADDKESVFHEEKKRKVVFTFSNISQTAQPPQLTHQALTLQRSVSYSHIAEDSLPLAVTGKRRLSDSYADDYISNLYLRGNGCVKTGSSTTAEPASAAVDQSIGSAAEDPHMVMLSSWLTNLHRIDKDVARCDRALEFFRPSNPENLTALRRIVCSYVWQHLDVGYIQGMCDLAAPFLVVCKESNELEFEAKAFTLFSKLMDRLGVNFPTGAVGASSGPAAMDIALSRMRSLIQILDPELYEHLQSDASGELDATHLYFAYRWLLLDFKREFVYSDVFRVWETIWAADDVASRSFSLFIAFALIETYRDVIVSEQMDFTDIIKFFNDMAERHDIERVLDLARQLVRRVQETAVASGPQSPMIAK